MRISNNEIEFEDSGWTVSSTSDNRIKVEHDNGEVYYFNDVGELEASSIDVKSVNTEELQNVADVIIEPEDDADAKIAGASEGEIIYFASGTHTDTSLRVQTPNVTITGSPTAELKLSDTASLADDSETVLAIEANGVTVKHLEINGNKGQHTGVSFNDSETWDGTGVYASDVTIENVYVHDTVGHGIIVWNSDRRGLGISEGPRSGNKILNNRVERSAQRSLIDFASVDTTLDPMRDMTARGNTCIGEGNSDEHGITIHTAVKTTIDGNYVEGTDFGLNIHESEAVRFVEDCTITNNRVVDTIGSGIRSSRVIFSEFSGNVISNPTNSAIEVDGRREGCSFDNNVMRQLDSRGVYFRDDNISSAVPLNGSVSNNSIKGASIHPIQIEDTTRMTVVGNAIDDSGAESIKEFGDANNNNIANNITDASIVTVGAGTVTDSNITGV